MIRVGGLCNLPVRDSPFCAVEVNTNLHNRETVLGKSECLSGISSLFCLYSLSIYLICKKIDRNKEKIQRNKSYFAFEACTSFKKSSGVKTGIFDNEKSFTFLVTTASTFSFIAA